MRVYHRWVENGRRKREEGEVRGSISLVRTQKKNHP